jgi:hypothetical protein
MRIALVHSFLLMFILTLEAELGVLWLPDQLHTFSFLS